MNATQLRRTQPSRIKQRNFVHKHAQRSGAGRHAQQSSRQRQREQQDRLDYFNAISLWRNY